MRITLLFIFTFCWVSLSYSLSKDAALDSFEVANQYYMDGDFQKALDLYENLHSQGFESADLYYNWGNSYYKTEQFALAIWCFEKALLLDPDFEDAKNNLEVANLTLVDEVEPVPQMALVAFWKKVKQTFSVKFWTYSSVLGLWVLAIGLFFLLGYAQYKKRQIGLVLSIVGVLFTLVTAIIAFDQHKRVQDSGFAIVTEPNIYVKSAPEKSSTDLFIIHSGLKVEIDDNISKWLKIKLSDGKTGWLKEDAVKPL